MLWLPSRPASAVSLRLRLCRIRSWFSCPTKRTGSIYDPALAGRRTVPRAARRLNSHLLKNAAFLSCASMLTFPLLGQHPGLTETMKLTSTMNSQQSIEQQSFILPMLWRQSMEDYYWPNGITSESLVSSVWLARKAVQGGASVSQADFIHSMAGAFEVFDLLVICDSLGKPDFSPHASLYEFMCFQNYDGMFDGDLGYMNMRLLLVLKSLNLTEDAALLRLCRDALAEFGDAESIDEAFFEQKGLRFLSDFSDDELYGAAEPLFDCGTFPLDVALVRRFVTELNDVVV